MIPRERDEIFRMAHAERVRYPRDPLCYCELMQVGVRVSVGIYVISVFSDFDEEGLCCATGNIFIIR
jgi:hypothetical protein